MFKKSKRIQGLMQRVIDNRRRLSTAQAELNDSYKNLYLAMGFTPEQVRRMVK